MSIPVFGTIVVLGRGKPEHLDEAILQSFVAEQLDSVERAAVSSHLESCGQCRSLHRKILSFQSLLSSMQPRDLDELSWRRIQHNVRETLEDEALQRPLERRNRRWLAAAAAALIIFTTGGWLGSTITKHHASEQVCEKSEPDSPEVARPDLPVPVEEEDLDFAEMDLEVRPTKSHDSDLSVGGVGRSMSSVEKRKSKVGLISRRKLIEKKQEDPRPSSEGETSVQVVSSPDMVAVRWNEACDAFYRARDTSRAIRLSEEIVRIGGERPEVMLAQEMLCDAYVADSRPDEAIAACSALLSKKTGERARIIHYRLATIYRTQLQDCGSAIRHYNQAIVFNQNSMLDDEARLFRAACSLELGDVDAAARDVKSLETRSGWLSQPGELENLRRKLRERQSE